MAHEVDAELAAHYGYSIQYMWRKNGKEMAHMKCPAKHTYDMYWHNFKPAENRFGCLECAKTARIDPTVKWAARNNLIMPADYTNSCTVHRWSCKHGHRFQDSVCNMKKTKRHPGAAICPHCEIAQIEWARGVTLNNYSTCRILPVGSRKIIHDWTCNTCHVVFSSRIRDMIMIGNCEHY